jgi:hypothetical protein
MNRFIASVSSFHFHCITLYHVPTSQHRINRMNDITRYNNDNSNPNTTTFPHLGDMYDSLPQSREECNFLLDADTFPGNPACIRVGPISSAIIPSLVSSWTLANKASNLSIVSSPSPSSSSSFSPSKLSPRPINLDGVFGSMDFPRQRPCRGSST